jgi:cytochrome c-type biogenesis protein CcmE
VRPDHRRDKLSFVKRKLVATALLIVAVSVAVVLGLTRSDQLTVRGLTEFLRQPVFDERVFLSGHLVQGTLCRVSDPCEVRFRISDRAAGDAGLPLGHTLAVSFPSCVMPRTLRDAPGVDVEVIVGGQVCATCHDFQASDVLARASSAAREQPSALDLGTLPDAFDDIPLCAAVR